MRRTAARLCHNDCVEVNEMLCGIVIVDEQINLIEL